ncbi:MAG: PQQ-dependent sugar dehydrogenase [Candidatus Latescibacterota bacterium]|nr:MAG: PQQ-dependent sugar dehydrogenase [Candidatus Latescibacterota bacterium]
MIFRLFSAAVLALVCAAPLRAQLQVENAFPNLSFLRPVDLQNPGDGTDRIFVVEQRGVIWVFENNAGVTQKKVFLDIQDRASPGSGEKGLLGLAFHPDYPDSGYFYVDYTAEEQFRTVVARYAVSPQNPDSALHDSEMILLEVDQPYSNHNAGQLAFGPDGLLYIALGDGGSGGDPLGNGQNLETLHGSLLRVDVDTTTASANYAIPADNPFAGNTQGYREEIYAYGLRNPWRFSFDHVTGRCWLADVGQEDYEEINLVKKGRNYGWKIMEGFHCYSPPVGCDTTGLTLPVWEYTHDVGFSVTGGYVYRGTQFPNLVGMYIYADYYFGIIWALDYNGSSPPLNLELVDAPFRITSFGVDVHGEVLICGLDGKIYKLVDNASGVGDTSDTPSPVRVNQNYPNPFNPTTVISFALPERMNTTLSIYDVSGEPVTTLIDDTVDGGYKEITWDGKDSRGNPVSSGVYFYRLTAGNQTITKKMVLVK